MPRPPQTFPELHIAASVDSPVARDLWIPSNSQPQWHSQHAQCSPPPLARLQWPLLPCWSRLSLVCASPHPPLLDRKYGGDTLPIKRKDEQTRPPTVLERDWARRSLVVNSWCRATSYSSREALCGSLATTATWHVSLKIEQELICLNGSNTFLTGPRPHNPRRTTRLRPLLPRPSAPPQAQIHRHRLRKGPTTSRTPQRSHPPPTWQNRIRDARDLRRARDRRPYHRPRNRPPWQRRDGRRPAINNQRRAERRERSQDDQEDWYWRGCGLEVDAQAWIPIPPG